MALVRSLRPIAEVLVTRVNGPSSLCTRRGFPGRRRDEAEAAAYPSQAVRSFNVSAVSRGGAGAPVKMGPVATSELPENHELVWDDGSINPEPCMDDPLPYYSSGDAAKLLAAGFGVYAAFYTMAVWNDKASKQPFVVRECQPLASRV